MKQSQAVAESTSFFELNLSKPMNFWSQAEEAAKISAPLSAQAQRAAE
jgi:hypothetical protein